MKVLKYILLGIIFGIILTKSEVISWFRIQEMFRFQSFHMYGVIGSAVLLGVIINIVIKKFDIKSLDKKPINFVVKEKTVIRYIVGGSIFGLGWALTGACPGPIFILIGNGFSIYIVIFLSALLGTFVYGILSKKLPH
ncbi:MAG: transporter [Thalassobius sp.]|nr:transporter [Thalassovita sp.]